MSLIEFKGRLEGRLHLFLWRQWTQLGVSGTVAGDDRWIIDPEALLLFTLEAARTESRLFDEVLDWLLKNGAMMDVQRLRNLQAGDKDYPAALVRAVALLLAEHETSAKWSRLAAPPASGPPASELLFIVRRGPLEWTPKPETLDPCFERAGFLRRKFEPRGLSQAIPMRAVPALRFRLRSFFGIGIRSEVIAYLLTHEGGTNGDAIARAVGYSIPGVHEVLREMADSDLIHVRREGREKRYWLERERWWSFMGLEERARSGDAEDLAARDLLPLMKLGGEERLRKARSMVNSLSPPADWIHWPRLFRGLSVVLRFLREAELEKMSDYLQASEFRRAVAAATDDLEGCELPFHVPRQSQSPVESYAKELASTLENLIGVLCR